MRRSGRTVKTEQWELVESSGELDNVEEVSQGQHNATASERIIDGL